MKLPGAKIRGVPGVGRVPDHSREVRAAYNTLAAGLGNVADTVERIEVDRLNQEAATAEHDAYIDKVNTEAREYSKTHYEAEDPLLTDLDIKRTEEQMINGKLTTVQRQLIPADEVWPELMQREYKEITQNRAAKISSPKRRLAFEQKAGQQAAADQLRMIEQTTRLQYNRAHEERKYQINQLRTVNTPEALSRIDEIIASEPDAARQAEMSEWWGRTKVFDQDTAIVTDAVRDLDVNALQAGYEKYLDYASGKKDYTGPLNQAELEDQAHYYKTHMNQVKSQISAGQATVKAYWLHQSRNIREALERGAPVSNEEKNAHMAEGRRLLSMDPDNETLIAEMLRMDDAAVAQRVFFDEISNVGPGNNFQQIEASMRRDVQSSNMSSTDRARANDVVNMFASLNTAMNEDPVTAMQTYNMVSDQAPLNDINFGDVKKLPDMLAEREASVNFYENLTGESFPHILKDHERTTLLDILGDDRLTDDDRINFIESTNVLQTDHSKFWGPLTTDAEYGQYAAIGQVISDYNDIGNPNRGRTMAKGIMNGYRMQKADPGIIEDYRDMREVMRKEFGYAYNGDLYSIADSYINNAVAYAIGTGQKPVISTNQVKKSLEAVTGGMIEFGGTKFLPPAPGMTQGDWDEYIDNYSSKNFKKPMLGWTPNDVIEGLRDESIVTQPTGISRNSFYLRSPDGGYIFGKDRQPIIFKHDPSAIRRRRQ